MLLMATVSACGHSYSVHTAAFSRKISNDERASVHTG